jgi:SAM-dependent methyltransferase|tara:strand:+ start:213 stop:851 length:639 start_codon:yes stop_codon:yes gene_type:complete
MLCKICGSEHVESFQTSDQKTYWNCLYCNGKFLDEDYLPSNLDEKERYLEHNNEINDPEYRSFLSKLARPLKEKILPNSTGLDFGCGHGPALADILKKDGFNVSLYDPFFYPNKDVLTKQYDFITCTETVEHFHNPWNEFNTLNALLKPNGWLGIMTSFLTSDEMFENWYYRRDPTHVTFYCEKTFEVIASQRNWICEIRSKDIALIRKNNE